MQENRNAGAVPLSLAAFQAPEHQPFVLPGKADGTSAALLIHGFPGTPAEMRPLAATLQQAGWTVEGLLLPGFGAQLESLSQRRHTEWILAARDAVITLRERHPHVLLVGYSMGAAVAVNVAAQFQQLDGLVLIAPFWQLGTRWQNALWPLFKLLVRQFRPFAKADFNDPQVQRDIRNFMPAADFADPATQQALRAFSVPVSLLEELRQVGRAAYQCAADITVPTLIVQGTQDEIVTPAQTQRLAQRLTASMQYIEVAANHHLIRLDNQGWPQLERQLVQFATQFV